MNSTGEATHVVPADQPTSVHQITARLFPAYTIDGGSVHLAGCLLEDRVFLRLTFRQGDSSVEICLDDAGREVEGRLIQSLGMTETVRLQTPRELSGPEIGRLIECGTRLVEQRFRQLGLPELVSTEVLWCKFAEGKLRFTVGEEVAELPFSGWTRPLEPPPFVCPYTGRRTFHLAATDDGRIVAADQIETCDETGRRLLHDDLVTCSATGRRVAPELTTTCPVGGQRVLRREMVECGTCRQLVSPKSLEGNQCGACRSLRPVHKADPRMARLLDEHPRLDRWKKWRISETASVYILVAVGWFNRLLVVADKDSLELKLLATGPRLFSGWRVAEPSQYDYVLRE